MKNIIHLVVAVVMSTMVYGQESIERVPPAQTDYETVYGPFEDEICKLCLPDGNYNLFPVIKRFVKPTIGVSVSTGFCQTNMGESNSYSLNFIFGMIENIELNLSLGNAFNTKLTKDIYVYYPDKQQTILGKESTTLDFIKTSFGVKLLPVNIGKFKPYIQYSFSNYDIHSETSVNQTVYTVGKYDVSDSHNYKNITSFKMQELSIGTKIELIRDNGIGMGINLSGTFSAGSPSFTETNYIESNELNKLQLSNYELGLYIQF
jgi:hypothetical protein